MSVNEYIYVILHFVLRESASIQQAYNILGTSSNNLWLFVNNQR